MDAANIMNPHANETSMDRCVGWRMDEYPKHTA